MVDTWLSPRKIFITLDIKQLGKDSHLEKEKTSIWKSVQVSLSWVFYVLKYEKFDSS